MKLSSLIVTVPLATVLLFSSGWAQQTPDPQSQPKTSTKRAKDGQKEKHLSGSLVDMGCMAKTLGAEVKTPSQPDSALAFPHLMGWGAVPPQTGQVTPAGPGTMQGPGQRTTDPGFPSDNQIPTSEDQRAQMAQVVRVENAARQCVASPFTQTLGLAMADGQVVQFDQDGCAKARGALNSADVEAGKKIKAKVVGTMEDKSTVNVASIEIKGKGKRGSANTGS